MQKVKISDLMQESGVKFGTSGARGLADNITDKVAYIYTKGFLQYLKSKNELKDTVAICGDLRPSTSRIMKACKKACEDLSLKAIGGEFVPSPCVALYGIKKNIPAIMVTGSHIPADRNGIKYNKPAGEILKEDEAGIKAQEVEYDETLFVNDNFKEEVKDFNESQEIKDLYIKRFLDAFPKDYLKGLTVVYYEHSAVGRDLIPSIYEALGAKVIKVGRSETFIPVDTEAVRKEDLELAKELSKKYNPNVILSTDGDSDRPLIFDENGKWIPGDILGVFTSRFLGASGVCVPVSVNSIVETTGEFKNVKKTKIGSPYVIKAMQDLESDGVKNIVGYEANGGFLQENDITINGKTLEALPTRDAIIVHLAAMNICKNQKLSAAVKDLHARCAISNRVQEFDTEKSLKIINSFKEDIEKIKQTFPFLNSKIINVDNTDGLRIYFEDNKVVHLRPSGNAPEFRCYVEGETEECAKDLLGKMISKMQELRN